MKKILLSLLVIAVVAGGYLGYQYIGGESAKGSFIPGIGVIGNIALTQKASLPATDPAFTKFKEEDIVLGRWKSNPDRWSRGVIKVVNKNENPVTYQVQYDDGDLVNGLKAEELAQYNLHPQLKTLKDQDFVVVRSKKDKCSKLGTACPEKDDSVFYGAQVKSQGGSNAKKITFKKIGTDVLNSVQASISPNDVWYAGGVVKPVVASHADVMEILAKHIKFEKVKGEWEKGVCSGSNCAEQWQDPKTGDMTVYYRIFVDSKDLATLSDNDLKLTILRKPLWGDPKSADSTLDNTEQGGKLIEYKDFPINLDNGYLNVAGSSQDKIKNTTLDDVPVNSGLPPDSKNPGTKKKQAISIVQNNDDKASIFVGVRIPFPVFPGTFNEGSNYVYGFDSEGNTKDGWGQTDIGFIVSDTAGKEIKLSTKDGKEYVTERIPKPVVIVNRDKGDDDINFKNIGKGIVPYNYYQKISYYASDSSLKGPTTLWHLFWDYDDGKFSFGHKVDEDNNGENPLPWYPGEGTKWYDIAYDTTGTKSWLLYDYKGTDWNWNGTKSDDGVGLNNPTIYSATVDSNF